MFYLEGISDLKFRSEKPKDASRKIVKTIKPNFSSLSYDETEKKELAAREEQHKKQQESAELYVSKEAREALSNDPNLHANILKFSRNPLETKFYVTAENVENKINNLYDQINYLSIDLKKQM
ncbi:MAG: hypothetical protein E7241_05400 [Lachnospiraceae bacterium]|jgi:hypothetical protein|nr:hypothetical protein [Lachnospiraceae bacterium]